MHASTVLLSSLTMLAALMTTAAASPAGNGDVAATAQQFLPTDIIEWSSREFQGRTGYEVVRKNARPAIHARCDNSASALYLERRIDLTATPVLEWTWLVETTLPGEFDETHRTGDDYAARIYAVIDGGWRTWRTRAVNYVWATHQREDASWDNAYARQARMLAVRSGEDDTGRWRTQRRNLREDFRILHGRDVGHIDGLALMTDCDDTGATVEAWYGEIRLLPEQSE
jgi:hypothetical protein